jgi:hypothetical protein
VLLLLLQRPLKCLQWHPLTGLLLLLGELRHPQGARAAAK